MFGASSRNDWKATLHFVRVSIASWRAQISYIVTLGLVSLHGVISVLWAVLVTIFKNIQMGK